MIRAGLALGALAPPAAMGCAAALLLAATDGILGGWLGFDRWHLHAPLAGLIRGLGLWLLLAPPSVLAAGGLMALGLRPWLSIILGTPLAAAGLCLAAALTWSGGPDGPLLDVGLRDALVWFAPAALAMTLALILGIRIAAGWRLRVERRAPPR